MLNSGYTLVTADGGHLHPELVLQIIFLMSNVFKFLWNDIFYGIEGVF